MDWYLRIALLPLFLFGGLILIISILLTISLLVIGLSNVVNHIVDRLVVLDKYSIRMSRWLNPREKIITRVLKIGLMTGPILLLVFYFGSLVYFAIDSGLHSNSNDSEDLTNNGEIILQQDKDRNNTRDEILLVLQAIQSSRKTNIDDALNQGFAERIEDLEFDYVSADLNSDGEAEYIVMPRQNVGVFSRTASGNGDILVLMNRNGKLVVVGELFGNGHTVTNDKNHGFYNITSSEHDSAVTSWQTIYSWEGDSLNGSYKMVADPILIKHEFE